MCLQPVNDFAIAEQTVQVARAVFPNGTWDIIIWNCDNAWSDERSAWTRDRQAASPNRDWPLTVHRGRRPQPVPSVDNGWGGQGTASGSFKVL